jgi:LysM repeat protein
MVRDTIMRSVIHSPHAPAARALVRLALVLLAFSRGHKVQAQPSYAVQGGYVPPSSYQTSAMPSAYRPQGSPPPAGMNVAQPQQPYYYYQQAPTQAAPSYPSRSTAKPKATTKPANTKSSSSSKQRSTPYVPSSAGRSAPRTALPVSEPQPASSEYRYDYEPYAYPDPPPAPKPRYDDEEVDKGFATAVREDIADLWSNDRRQDQRIAELERDARYGSQRTTPRQETSSRYTVRYGDSLSEIAARHGTTVAALRSANGLRSDVLLEGQTLLIPTRGGSGIVKSVPKQITPRSDGTHTVQPGESLSAIASAYRVSLSSRKLTIPGRTSPVGPVKKTTAPKKQSTVTHYVSTKTTYTPPTAGSGTKVDKSTKSEPLLGGIASYRVQPDDTLDSIAHHFNTKPDELRRINSLSDGYRPKSGDELVVPSPAPVAL